jgi:hypothetical protein
MRYTGNILITSDSPYYPNIVEEIHRNIFEGVDGRPGIAIPLWYWHAHNPQPLEVFETSEYSGTYSQEEFIARLLTQPNTWHEAHIYSESKPQTSSQHLRLNRAKPDFVSDPEYALPHVPESIPFWGSRLDRYIRFVDGDLTTTLEICNFATPTLDPYTFDLAHYGGDSALMMADLFKLVNRL